MNWFLLTRLSSAQIRPEVPQGQKKGLRVLSAEEDIARKLLTSLNKAQKAQTIINADAPSDILTRDVPKVEFEAVEGLAAEAMETQQRELLMETCPRIH